MSSPARTVNVQEAKTHLSRLLREVEAGGEIAIARGGRVIARLVRAQEAGPRGWGSFAGAVRFTPDAFDPMTEADASLWDGPGVEPPRKP